MSSKKASSYSIVSYLVCMCCECCGPCECPTDVDGLGRWDGFATELEASDRVKEFKARPTIDYRISHKVIRVGPLGGEKVIAHYA